MLTHIRIKLLKSTKITFEINVRTFQLLFIPLCVSLCEMSSQFSPENIKLDNTEQPVVPELEELESTRVLLLLLSPTCRKNVYQ